MSKEKQIDEIFMIISDVACGDIAEDECDAKDSCCYCRAERLYNAGYRKQSEGEWISVEERLPDIEPHGKGRYGGRRSVRVLCACKQRDGRTFVKEGYCEPCGSGKIVWRIPGSIDSVTHWMPLPSPPDMKGGAE